jgi:hypothetical protein
MAIPSSWPEPVQRRASKFLALLKYYRMSRTLSEAAGGYFAKQAAGALNDPAEVLRYGAFVSYWFASLQTVCEGWEELGLSDPAVDAQLTPNHLLVLKQYRHTVFHFQANLEQARIVAFERSHEHIGWAMALGDAFQQFFDPHLDAIQVDRIRAWLFAPTGAG